MCVLVFVMQCHCSVVIGIILCRDFRPLWSYSLTALSHGSAPIAETSPAGKTSAGLSGVQNHPLVPASGHGFRSA